MTISFLLTVFHGLYTLFIMVLCDFVVTILLRIMYVLIMFYIVLCYRLTSFCKMNYDG